MRKNPYFKTDKEFNDRIHNSEKSCCTDCGYEGHPSTHPSDHPMRNKETYKGGGVFGNEV